MPTTTEREIIQRRKAKGILVPILEDVLSRNLEIVDDKDEWFMLNLMRAASAERERGVFSPSMLGDCMRQAYFAKTGKERFPAKTARANAYFLDGKFRHLKWQFALWKAHRRGLLVLLGCEIRVYHPNGDFAGTVDGAVRIPDYGDEVFIPDFKGMHVRAWQTFEKMGTPDNYRIQIGGYGEIINRSGVLDGFMGRHEGIHIERCLLIGENKGGPTQQGSPIALHEDVVVVRHAKSSVKSRINRLRGYVKREEIPPPACTSTRTIGFQECPFAPHCRDEVRAIQRQLEKGARSRRKPVRVARVSRRKD